MKKSLLTLLLLFIGLGYMMAQRTISGKVSDAEGGPIVGATVLITGTSSGTITDENGDFTLSVPNEATSLTVTSVGFLTNTITLGAASYYSLSLGADQHQLDELVVTALGIERSEKSVGYATQKIDGDAVSSVKETNFLNSLSGKTAGVNVTGGSGNLGGSTRITMRGLTSITGQNQPLFVVDGIPMDNSNFTSSNQARGGGGIDYGNSISDINPDDIESMNILRGPTASALYGSRGANGVIVITTKKGVKGKKPIGISVGTGVTFSNVAVLPNYQNSYGGGYDWNGEIDGVNVPDFATDESWGPKLDGTPARQFYSFTPYAPEYYNKATPWSPQPNNIKDFFETGVSNNNSLSVSGGNEMYAIRLSYGNTNEKGVMPNSKLNKHSFALNASTDITKWLNISGMGTFVTTKAKGRSGTGYDGLNVMQPFNQWHQRQIDMGILKKYYELPDGSQMTWNRTSAENPTPKYTDNPYWTRFKNYENDGRDRFYGTIVATVKLLPSVNVVGKLSRDGYEDTREERIAVGSQDIPYYGKFVRNLNEVNKEVYLNFNPKISNNFTLVSFVGAARRDFEYSLNSAESVGGLNIPNFYNINNSTGNPLVTQRNENKRVNSVLGSASLGFNEMLYLDVTARNDWSSTLPLNNNSYFYPSVTGSFVFSEVMKDMKWLDFGKVRLGYAEVGNDAPSYILNETYPSSVPVSGNGSSGINNALANPNLKSETTKAIEGGLEMRMFRNRINFNLSLYDQNTVDQILPLTTSPSSGYSTIYINAGKLNNKGVELTLGLIPLRTKDFEWEITLNWARNRNKIVELYTDAKGNKVTNYQLINAPFSVTLNATVGQPFGTILGTDFVRDSATGEKLVDADGFYVYDPTLKNLGSIQPDWTGGIYNEFRWKGLNFGFLVDMKKGGKLFSTSVMFGRYSGLLEETAENGIRENGVVAEGINEEGNKNDVAIAASDYFQQFYSIAGNNVFDAGFVKLREVKLGYTFPARWTSKINVSNVNLSFIGRNLWIIKKNVPHIDPDNAISASNIQGLEGAQLPSTRTLGASLTFNF